MCILFIGDTAAAYLTSFALVGHVHFLHLFDCHELTDSHVPSLPLDGCYILTDVSAATNTYTGKKQNLYILDYCFVMMDVLGFIRSDDCLPPMQWSMEDITFLTPTAASYG